MKYIFVCTNEFLKFFAKIQLDAKTKELKMMNASHGVIEHAHLLVYD
jgi:hypothetical protein